MEGKRTAQAEASARRGGAAVWIGLAAAAVLAAAAGFCVYANTYSGVFPGVTMAGIELEGKGLKELRDTLTQALPSSLDGQEVTVTAGGETLGTYSLTELGARADTAGAADAAWQIGREEGALGWLKNGWTMAVCRLGGGRALEPAVTYDRDTLNRAVSTIASRFDRAPVDGSYTLDRDGLFATKELDGRSLDTDDLKAKLQAGPGEAVEAVWTEAEAEGLDLEKLARELEGTPSNARYDIETGQVVDGEVGFRLDPEAAAYVLEAAEGGETVKLPADVTFPTMTAQELEAVLFRDELATYTTNVSGSRSRRGNIQLAGSTVNGTVLNDGDIFDYNQVVGKRTAERGFGAAATYVNGETVDTIGGGICQVSSTIYMTALLSNLEITERYAHRYYPGYITKGMDATVSWGGPEFRFKNNTGYPIRIDVSYADSKLTVTIVGTKTDDTYVKMTYEQLSTSGYETEYVETEDLPWGTQQVKQTPYIGYEVISYRNIYDGNDNLVSSAVEARSSYKSRNQIILVGVNGRPPLEEEPVPPAVGQDPGSGAPAGGSAEPVDPGAAGRGLDNMPGGTDPEPTPPPAQLPEETAPAAPPPANDEPPDWL